MDAYIDIKPDDDKYTYNQSEYGTVNIHVKNWAPDGFTNYFLKVPGDVEYVEVYDGPQPTYVYDLPTSEDFALIPNYGFVWGPATVLHWQTMHLCGYEKHIKVKVKYDNTGNFTHYAHDHEQEMLSGFSAWDDDSFKVTVS